MALNIAKLREELKAEINVFAVARETYGLDVDEKFDSTDEVIELICGEEYRLAFI